METDSAVRWWIIQTIAPAQVLSATRTGPDGVLASGGTNHDGTGLSTGAKAGIGAGVALGACVVLGALMWFCIVHRRRAMNAKSRHESSVPTLSQVSGEKNDKRPSAGRMPSDYFGPAASHGPFSTDSMSPRGSPEEQKGVPLSPHSPGDIAAPVEIDSRDHSNGTSPGFVNKYMKGPIAAEFSIEVP